MSARRRRSPAGADFSVADCGLLIADSRAEDDPAPFVFIPSENIVKLNPQSEFRNPQPLQFRPDERAAEGAARADVLVAVDLGQNLFAEHFRGRAFRDQLAAA